MTTIKSYTSLEQSRKLAEFLSLESADYFHAPDAGVVVTEPYQLDEGDETVITAYKGAVPCWSLAALLDILTEQDFTIKTIGNEFNIDIPIRHCKIWFSSLLDAAFEMVCWLKENNEI